MFILSFYNQASAEQRPTGDTPSQECVANLNLQDLPEEILRHVFSFLPDDEVHYNIRRVCRQLLRYVEAYVEIGNYSNN